MACLRQKVIKPLIHVVKGTKVGHESHFVKGLPLVTVGLRLARITSTKGELLFCEAIEFANRLAGVDTVLRRAALSGRVEVGGTIEDHFADVLGADGDIVETVALDRRSYSVLKNRWMRCKREPR